jgi:NAD+ diphosphatase
LNYSENIHYVGLQLDRAGELRKDPTWLEDQWNRSDCRILLLKNDHNLMSWQVAQEKSPVSINHTRDEVEGLLGQVSTRVFLGLDNGVPLFALDVSDCDEDVMQPILADNEFFDLRQAGWLLNSQEAALLAYARGLLYWHRHSGFCGTCGSPTESQQGGHMQLCSSKDCARMTFPRTDPAVIMLVEHWPDSGPPLCLLGRNARFADRMMSTLAGFVDPLESLEESVTREVFEECGIKVDQVSYQASQPWPFPASIMLGFRARAITTDIRVDQVEIEEAYWFSADELRDFGEWGDEGEGYCLPRKDSIARFLVESWITDSKRRP